MGSFWSDTLWKSQNAHPENRRAATSKTVPPVNLSATRRRLLVGGEPVRGNLILYVGVNNLKNPEQRRYELVDPPANDPRHGPAISVTSYAPAARYELSRDPSGEDLKKISRRIAADLSALVNANRLTLAQ